MYGCSGEISEVSFGYFGIFHFLFMSAPGAVPFLFICWDDHAGIADGPPFFAGTAIEMMELFHGQSASGSDEIIGGSGHIWFNFSGDRSYRRVLVGGNAKPHMYHLGSR